MGAFGNLTYKDVARKLRKLGFAFYRQASGSHEVWRNSETMRKVTIPHHSGNMKEDTLKAILEQARIDIEVFLAA